MSPFSTFAEKANHALLEDLKNKRIPEEDWDKITFNFLQGFEYGWKLSAPKCVEMIQFYKPVCCTKKPPIPKSLFNAA
jgi:hypothetical protein